MNADKLILLVENNSDDVCLLKREFDRANILNPIQSVASAAEAVSYLHSAGDFADRRLHPYPALIILNIHMPDREGFELLSYLREGVRSDLPIIAIGESERPVDVREAFDMGVNAFYAKGVDLRGVVRLIENLDFLDEVLRFESLPQLPQLAFAGN